MLSPRDLGPLLEAVAVPPQLDGLVRAAAAAIEAGRADEAIRPLESLSGSDAVVVPWLLGAAHLSRSDYARAAPLLERALQLQPALPGAQIAYAQVLEVFDELESAAEYLRACLQQRPDHVGAIAGLARVYNRSGRLDRAEALARRGLELVPEHPALLRALADALRRQDRHEDAVRVLEVAVRATPNDETAAVALGRSLLKLGRSLEAAPVFERVLRRNAESTGALAGIAESLELSGRHAEAQGYLLRAMAAAPEQSWLHLLHGRLAANTGNLLGAEQAAAQAAALPGPEHTRIDALRLAVRVSRGRGDLDGSDDYARRLLEWSPDDPEGRVARALMRVLDGAAEEVRGDLTARSSGARPQHEALVALGCALYVTGDDRGAADRAIAALKASPDDLLAQRLLTLVYEPTHTPAEERASRLRARLTAPSVPANDSTTASRVGEVPGGGLHPSGRIGHRVTGPIPLVEMAVHQLLTPDRAPATPARGMPAVGASPRARPSGALELTAMPTRAASGSMPAITVMSPEEAAAHAEDSVEETAERVAPDDGALAGETELAALRGLLERARRVLTGDGELAPDRSVVERLADTLDDPITLAVVGPRGAGKTTFVNALIGEDLLPTSSVVPHLLRYGRKAASRIVHHDGAVETVPIETLREVLERRAVELKDTHVRHVELVYPIGELTRANVLEVPDLRMDGPGSPEELSANEALVQSADALVWLAGIDQGIEPWRLAARFLEAHARPALAVVTRIEGHDAAQVDMAVSRALVTLGRRVEDVVAVSARVALSGLRSRNLEDLRRSGIAKLHRLLRARFFGRSALIKASSTRKRLLEALRGALRQVDARAERLAARHATVAALGAQLGLDRVRLAREVREDVPPRVRAAVERAVRETAPELVEIAREHRGGQARVHALRALRRSLRVRVGEAVATIGDELDERIDRSFHGYFERLEVVFGGEVSTQAQRVPALRGLLEGHRMLRLEQRFGRYQAYLEGWIDQAPLGPLLDDPLVSRGVEAVAAGLRNHGLALDLLPPIDLAEVAESLFDGFAEFAGETEAEVRVSQIELGTRLGEPLRRLIHEVETLPVGVSEPKGERS